jgi:hypothetical protein
MLRQASLQLETLIRRALGGVESGAMLVADADFIEQGGAFPAIVAALSPYYVGASDGHQEKINHFLNRYRYLHHGPLSSYEDDVYQLTIELRSFFINDLGVVLKNIQSK